MTRFRLVVTRSLALAGVVGIVLGVASFGIGVRGAEAQTSPTVRGYGSTWSENAIAQWRADVARFGLKIDYQGNGSSAGRQFFINGQADFAVSEIPFQPGETSPRPFTYMPIVAGGTALMYNLTVGGQRVTNLQLSAPTMAGIFTGTIQFWDDPAIQADNGGANYGHQRITPVVRSDGSGTSAQFSGYLRATVPNLFPEPGNRSQFPPPANGAAAQFSDGVADFVNNEQTGAGSITYVETSYAIQRGRPVVKAKNAAGAYVLPTSGNVGIALTRAVINPDRTQNLAGVYSNPDANAYPISSYSYAIMPTTGFDPAKGLALGRFIIYFLCDGQRKAEVLGYSPLPANLQQVAFDAMKEIPGAPPPLSIDDCRRAGVSSAAAQSPTGKATGAGGTAASGQGTTATTAATATDTSGTGTGTSAEEALGLGTAAGAAHRVTLRGGATSTLPLVLAGIGLLAMVLVPPIAAGFATNRRAGSGASAAALPGSAGPPLEVVSTVAPEAAIAGGAASLAAGGSGERRRRLRLGRKRSGAAAAAAAVTGASEAAAAAGASQTGPNGNGSAEETGPGPSEATGPSEVDDRVALHQVVDAPDAGALPSADPRISEGS